MYLQSASYIREVNKVYHVRNSVTRCISDHQCQEKEFIVSIHLKILFSGGNSSFSVGLAELE